MNTTDNQRLLQHIRRLAGDPSGPPSDGELLQRYMRCRDEAAFTALMRRHGPMVFSVCQSVLRQRDDAEDAFQAAFLILARKAGTVRRHEGLGGWLQRVAYRVALKARADNLRRQQREAKTVRSAVEEPSGDELSWAELRAILHAELAALPESLRAPLVLCYLEGRTQEEAARQLEWPLSTVRGRLQRGREKLRRRLERRGVALTAALGAALTGQTMVEVAVPSSVLPTTAAITLARGFLCPLPPLKLAMLSAILTISIVAGGIALRSPVEPRPLGSGGADRGSDRSLTVAAPQKTVDAHGDPLPEGAIARLGTVRFNHGEGLRHLFFSPDGKTIYSEGGGWLRVWDAATGAERGHFASAEHSLEALVLTPDGKKIVSLNQENQGVNDVVRVWDVASMTKVRTLSLPVRRLEKSVTRRNALSPDGRLGAINLQAEMRIFDLTTGRELYKLAKGGKEIQDVVFAGDRLVTADAKQMIDVWDARTGKSMRQFSHGAPAQVLATSPDGRWLATLEHHNYAIDRLLDKDVVRVWDLHAGTQKHTLAARPKRWFMGLYFSPDSKYLLASSASGGKGELSAWNVETGERVREMDDSYVMVLAVSPDGSRLATGNEPGKFELWDFRAGHRLSNEDGRFARAAALAFSPTDESIVLLGYTALSTWEIATGRRKTSSNLPAHSFAPPFPAFSPDARYAFSYIGEEWAKRQAVIWDVANHERLHTIETSAQFTAFSPDSSLFATWYMEKEGGIVRLWDVRTGKEVRSFRDKKAGYPGRLFFSADGKTLFVAGWALAGYEVASGKELFSWQIPPVPSQVPGERKSPWRTVALSPQGSVIAAIRTEFVSPDGRIVLYNARTGKVLRRWNDSGKMTLKWLEQLAFSQDGSLLASSDGDVVHLWEVATGKEIRSFRGHRGAIEFLAFSHDDRRLASASWDSIVLIWDATGSPGRLTTAAALEEAWQALTGDDAKRAQDAVWALARTPEKSISLLKARLHPVKPVSGEHLERLIKDLDSDQFIVREKATVALQKLGELAEPALRRILKGKLTLEQRRRIESILPELESKPPVGEALRSLRAVRVLEYAGTPETRRLLRELAGGAEGAVLTQQAQAALMRLNRRAS
ncbi:MAG TPA: sigma-70 family RNA polymerase sigma factor [Gemmataceae bacterium]|nr:sigma-70 family RNA polymerase sigma factor [Gemmataceae bacterium]